MTVFYVFGSHGDLTCCASTGRIIERSDDGAYSNLASLDVAEWRAAYPGESLAEGSHDILDFGGVTVTGETFGPEEDWREEFRALRGLVLNSSANGLFK